MTAKESMEKYGFLFVCHEVYDDNICRYKTHHYVARSPEIIKKAEALNEAGTYHIISKEEFIEWFGEPTKEKLDEINCYFNQLCIVTEEYDGKEIRFSDGNNISKDLRVKVIKELLKK